MKRRATALCALNFLGAVAFAQSSTPNTAGTIAGRVLRADTGAPMASALVTLMPDTEGATVSDRRTRTREDGGFSFTGVTPGDYNLRPEKNGFLAAEYDDVDQDSQGDSLTVGRGANLKGIDLRLRRWGVISGTVTDETGDPVQGVRVIAVRPCYWPRGDRTFDVPASTYTNDLGQYRLAGLEAGDYYVGAGSGSDTGDKHLPDNARYTGAFYPAAEKISDAQIIEIAAGTEASAINFAVRIELNSYAIRGAVAGVGPGEFQNTSVQIRQESLAGITSYGDPMAYINVGKDGSFSLPSVSPGDYEIEAQHFQRSPTAKDDQVSVQVGLVTVRVTDADVGVRVAIPTAAIVHVKANLQNGDRPAGRNQGLFLVPADATATVGSANLPCCRTFDALGGFTFQDVMPGSYYFSLTGPFSAASYVERVVCNGTDYSEQPLVVSAGDAKFDCEMTIVADGAKLTGKVMNEKGPVRGYTVVAIPESQALRPLSGRVVGSPMPSDKKEGHFQIPALRPGDYLVFAVPYDRQQRYFAPDFAERNSESAVKIPIEPGESQNITLYPTNPR
jgi:hypothetical protein